MTPFESVADYIQRQAGVSQYCVAYSGGMDSHVLLLLMAQLKQEDTALQLRAVHVNHGLQADCEHWAVHAESVCEQLDIPLEIRRVDVDSPREEGPEAAARIARYTAFSECLRPQEHLLLAQHAEDQAETFLLLALRGSGLDGLAAIPRKRRFGEGFMGRPLLGCSRESLKVVAKSHDLSWIEDPSNADDKFDRNYLRLHVMPQLKARWPAYAQTLGRSAQRSAAASQTLLGLAHQDLAALTIEGTTEISITGLGELPNERAFTVLRLFVRQRGLRMPRLQDLVQVMSDIVNARADTNGIVNARDYVFRRYKDSLYVLPQQAELKPFHYTWEAPYEPLAIAEASMMLSKDLCIEEGLQLPFNGPISVKSREGGELLRIGEPAFHKSVKKILQESALPPWVRERIPLIYVEDRLAAVWGVINSVDFQTTTDPVAGDTSSVNAPDNLDDCTLA